MSKYFHKPKPLGENVKVACEMWNVLDLPNYATKSDLKKAAAVDTSDFAQNVDLATLKSNVDN